MRRQRAQLNILNHVKDVNRSINIEKSIYNFAIETTQKIGVDASWDDTRFSGVYKQKYMDILLHLRDADNPLHKLLETKEVLSKEVAYLKPSQLNPDMWKSDIEVQTDDVVDGIFQCKKCSSKRTTYYSLQTRSSDEPMTNFITCVECKNRWKM